MTNSDIALHNFTKRSFQVQYALWYISSKYCMPDLNFKVTDFLTWVPDPQTEVQDPKTEVPDLGSGWI